MICLAGVTKSYGERRVLRGIDFTVPMGNVACLIGPSGSGKSTVLRCINGLETHDGGTITVESDIVSDTSLSNIRRRVSMVFQRSNLFPHRTVLENVIEGPVYVLKQSAKDAQELGMALLDKVGLADRGTSFPEQLSGGEQQRVGIARALAMQPQAILFDEPTSALDPERVGEVLRVMRTLADEGMTMIVVTHEIAFAAEVADRVMVIDEGVIIEDGAARNVLGSPGHPRTQLFLNRVLRPI